MKPIGRFLALPAILALSSLVFSQEPHEATVAEPALRSELLERVKADQAIRNELIAAGVKEPDKEILARMQAIDADNTKRMKAIIEAHGWPGPDLIGRDGVGAAFLIVQHAEHEFQKKTLPLVEKAYKAGEMPGQNYALLLDRVLIGEGKKQVYGTQAKPIESWNGHEPSLQPMEDELNVDKRRAEVGLPPLSEYLKLLKEVYFPGDQQTTKDQPGQV